MQGEKYEYWTSCEERRCRQLLQMFQFSVESPSYPSARLIANLLHMQVRSYCNDRNLQCPSLITHWPLGLLQLTSCVLHWLGQPTISKKIGRHDPYLMVDNSLRPHAAEKDSTEWSNCHACAMPVPHQLLANWPGKYSSCLWCLRVLTCSTCQASRL
jgi:hypothetical protein